MKEQMKWNIMQRKEMKENEVKDIEWQVIIGKKMKKEKK